LSFLLFSRLILNRRKITDQHSPTKKIINPDFAHKKSSPKAAFFNDLKLKA